MEKLILNTSRDAYSVNEVGATMTVAELISFLSDYDDDTEVVLSFDRGYTYGRITSERFEEAYEEGEE